MELYDEVVRGEWRVERRAVETEILYSIIYYEEADYHNML